ncbi:MAG: histidine phosphatase family protein [Burkholderiaceae bacterium]
MNLRRLLLCAVLGVCCGVAAAQQSELANTESSVPDPAKALAGRALLKALRSGGLVIYFRHTATDFSRSDSAMTSYTDCAKQRLLSTQGRDDAVRLGRDLRALKLRLDDLTQVLASPMCRTMEHATLTFGYAKPMPELREAQAGDYQELKHLLAAPVPRGGNRWIVGHGNPFRAVAGPPHLAEGEAVVIRPGTTRWTVLARVTVDQWAGLDSR